MAVYKVLVGRNQLGNAGTIKSFPEDVAKRYIKDGLIEEVSETETRPRTRNKPTSGE